ncbi:MAG: ATP synthase F1 subunit delta [Bacteroidales bacterium]
MNQGMIAFRYARALLDTGRSRGVEDRIYSDLTLLSQLLKEVSTFHLFLHNQDAPSKKLTLFKATLFPHLHPLTCTFLELLVSKKREALLALMIRSFGRQYKAFKGIRDVLVTVATPPDSAEKARWEAVMHNILGSAVEVEVQQNSDIIEGFSIEIDHQLYDATVKSALQAMEKAFSQKVPISLKA